MASKLKIAGTWAGVLEVELENWTGPKFLPQGFRRASSASLPHQWPLHLFLRLRYLPPRLLRYRLRPVLHRAADTNIDDWHEHEVLELPPPRPPQQKKDEQLISKEDEEIVESVLSGTTASRWESLDRCCSTEKSTWCQTEGCLVASTNRGFKAIYSSGGAENVLFNDSITRAPIV
ncbi:hypothetical protein ACFXTO_033370 [Malus domestica]